MFHILQTLCYTYTYARVCTPYSTVCARVSYGAQVELSSFSLTQLRLCNENQTAAFWMSIFESLRLSPKQVERAAVSKPTCYDHFHHLQWRIIIKYDVFMAVNILYYGLLGYETVKSGQRLPNFRSNRLPPSEFLQPTRITNSSMRGPSQRKVKSCLSALEGAETHLHSFFASALDADEWSTPRFGRFTIRVSAVGTHWIGVLSGPHSRSGEFGGKKNITAARNRSYPGCDTRVVEWAVQHTIKLFLHWSTTPWGCTGKVEVRNHIFST